MRSRAIANGRIEHGGWPLVPLGLAIGAVGLKEVTGCTPYLGPQTSESRSDDTSGRRSPLAALVDVDEFAGLEGLTITARRDMSDTHWPVVFWVDPNLARLTCTCGAVDTEPVVLRHMLAFEAAEERLLHRHACSAPAVGGPYEADFMQTDI